MTSGASLSAVLHRASAVRTREPAGTLTKLPEPVRLVRKPSARSASYAAVTVARLICRATASSRSDGSRVSVAMRASRMSAVMAELRAV